VDLVSCGDHPNPAVESFSRGKNSPVEGVKRKEMNWEGSQEKMM
jgi:hypothetical protein